MKAEGWSPSSGKARAVLAAFTCGFMASCTATPGPGFDMAAPSYTGGGVVSVMAEVAQSEDGGQQPSTAPSETSSPSEADGEKKTTLPEQVALVPADKPATTKIAAEGSASAVQDDAKAAEPAHSTSKPSTPPEDDVTVATVTPDQATGNAKPETADAASPATEIAATTTDEDEPQQVAAAEEPKKKGFLAYFFSPQPGKPAPSPIAKRKPAAAAAEKTPLIDPAEKPKPVINLASVNPQERSVQKAALVPMDALPGVRQGSLFEISRKDGIDDDSDIDLNEGEGGDVYQVASAAGLARLAPNGLLKQRDSVDVACLKPALVRMLKTVEQRFGKKLIVTSGYRSPDHNRRVRGARNSMHMYCAAADVQVPGVSKWEIAQFVRAMPGRGGVGTYCHTNSVHLDVGPERDWNWRCRRRK